MVNEGIVLGHKVSERGIEVDKAKVDAIEKMPCPKDIKGIRSFLGHAGFYRRFIKDFSKISRPLTNLLQKDIPFVFDKDGNGSGLDRVEQYQIHIHIHEGSPSPSMKYPWAKNCDHVQIRWISIPIGYPPCVGVEAGSGGHL